MARAAGGRQCHTARRCNLVRGSAQSFALDACTCVWKVAAGHTRHEHLSDTRARRRRCVARAVRSHKYLGRRTRDAPGDTGARATHRRVPSSARGRRAAAARAVHAAQQAVAAAPGGEKQPCTGMYRAAVEHVSGDRRTVGPVAIHVLRAQRRPRPRLTAGAGRQRQSLAATFLGVRPAATWMLPDFSDRCLARVLGHPPRQARMPPLRTHTLQCRAQRLPHGDLRRRSAGATEPQRCVASAEPTDPTWNTCFEDVSAPSDCSRRPTPPHATRRTPVQWGVPQQSGLGLAAHS